MTPPIQPLFGAQPLADWISLGGRPERSIRAYRPRSWWHARLFEFNWGITESRLSSLGLPENPIFIIGLWRSGTTIFHELLSAVTGWNTPNTWQCFNPSTCFLTSPPSTKSTGRPMDQGRISTLSPQEDEFALLMLGEPSIYRAFIDPRRLDECADDLWSGKSHLRERLPRWQSFLRGLHSTAPGVPLILKSPTHTFRLPLLIKIFPTAKFIWVARNIDDVISSNVRMWRLMMSSYGLWACPDKSLDRFFQHMLGASACVLTQCLDELTGEKLLWVDFESLLANRVGVLQRVAEFIGLHRLHRPDTLIERIKQSVAVLPMHQRERMSSHENVDGEQLRALMAAARQRFG